MKNIKIEQELVGRDFWPRVAFVDVSGIDDANKFPKDGTEQDMEEVIQSWENIAVLKVNPNIPFKFGYIQGNAFHYLKEDIINNDGTFGVRIGDSDIRFFVIPNSLDCDMHIDLIKITKEDDPNYKDLPLY